eukprot:g83324.t1
MTPLCSPVSPSLSLLQKATVATVPRLDGNKSFSEEKQVRANSQTGTTGLVLLGQGSEPHLLDREVAGGASYTFAAVTAQYSVIQVQPRTLTAYSTDVKASESPSCSDWQLEVGPDCSN